MSLPQLISEKTPPIIRTDSSFHEQALLSRASPPSSRLKAWEVSPTKNLEGAPFNDQAPPQSAKALEDYLAAAYHSDKKNATQVFIVEQKHSRASLNTTSGDLKALLDRLVAFPGLGKVVKAFERDASDCYLGKAGAHFSPAVGDSKILELCCLLKYVEPNTRRSTLPAVEGSESYAEVQRWSIRQMACYQSYHPSRCFETVLLVNPSTSIWESFTTAFRTRRNTAEPYANSLATTLLAFDSLTANWASYVSALHKAVEEVKNDASFTDPKQKRIDEADTRSMETCVDLMDRLHHARHVLTSNMETLDAALKELRKRQKCEAIQASEKEWVVFESGTDDAKRELGFHRSQIGLIIGRLERVTATVRDLVSLRNSYTMETMTARSILEARAVRVIALVTLCFLPPTFTSGFLEMNNVHVRSRSGHLLIDVDPSFLFYLAITLPLMLVTVGGWLVWDWRSMRKARAEQPLLLT